MKRWLIVLVMAGLLGGTALGTGPAAAAPAVDICHHPTLGGNYICSYGVTTHTFPDGRRQLFVVGTDYGVWSRWELGGGTWNGDWYDMEGDVRSVIQLKHNNTNHPWIEARGTDGNRWYRHRNSTTERWSAWARV
jgi:hypothetical protein